MTLAASSVFLTVLCENVSGYIIGSYPIDELLVGRQWIRLPFSNIVVMYWSISEMLPCRDNFLVVVKRFGTHYGVQFDQIVYFGNESFDNSLVVTAIELKR